MGHLLKLNMSIVNFCMSLYNEANAKFSTIVVDTKWITVCRRKTLEAVSAFLMRSNLLIASFLVSLLIGMLYTCIIVRRKNRREAINVDTLVLAEWVRRVGAKKDDNKKLVALLIYSLYQVDYALLNTVLSKINQKH